MRTTAVTMAVTLALWTADAIGQGERLGFFELAAGPRQETIVVHNRRDGSTARLKIANGYLQEAQRGEFGRSHRAAGIILYLNPETLAPLLGIINQDWQNIPWTSRLILGADVKAAFRLDFSEIDFGRATSTRNLIIARHPDALLQIDASRMKFILPDPRPADSSFPTPDNLELFILDPARSQGAFAKSYVECWRLTGAQVASQRRCVLRAEYRSMRLSIDVSESTLQQLASFQRRLRSLIDAAVTE